MISKEFPDNIRDSIIAKKEQVGSEGYEVIDAKMSLSGKESHVPDVALLVLLWTVDVVNYFREQIRRGRRPRRETRRHAPDREWGDGFPSLLYASSMVSVLGVVDSIAGTNTPIFSIHAERKALLR